ncbi:hypothetical protein ACFQFC_19510 [Amorphoplanes digitatis]|uniref:Lipoprotein n=1 Tax=Actinoplanes digitatis TaxID=1868 RepID=A0A7W7I4P5_9ACTN|nr:hypothetical protein [Actinoplanes digitatis]MBB4766405.1 hypothetical protein [Actinoplanes digitatis]
MLLSRRRAVAAVLVLFAAATAGCSDLDDPGQGLARNDLVSDLAAQMSGAAALTYEASYHLSGGGTATVAQAQAPTRSAYVYPGGKVTVTTDATTLCDTGANATTCTMTAPATPTSPPPAKVFEGADATGMVLPSTVQALLNAAVLDNDVEVVQHDTTIAGRHATCVRLAGVDGAATRDFTTCITNEGALGSFSGFLNSVRVEVAMTHYAEKVADEMFEVPKKAKLVDRRAQAGGDRP